MKKIVIGTLTSVFLLSGTVFAASNGLFQGNPIVNVTVDGNKVEGDVPAISLNGRTMVPLRFVSEALGAQVNWNGNTNTASITSPAISVSPSNQDGIQKLKDYTLIMSFYQQLKEISGFTGMIERYLSDLSRNKNDTYSRTQLEESLKSTTYFYNEALRDSTQLIDIMKQRGIDISDIKTILSSYNDAINAYKKVYSSGDFSYLYTASLKNSEAFRASTDGFMKFRGLILNY